jgi:hypothetical protein
MPGPPQNATPCNYFCYRRAARFCQQAYALIRISPFDTSTVPGAQTWIGFTHEYSGWLLVSVTFSLS